MSSGAPPVNSMVTFVPEVYLDSFNCAFFDVLVFPKNCHRDFPFKRYLIIAVQKNSKDIIKRVFIKLFSRSCRGIKAAG